MSSNERVKTYSTCFKRKMFNQADRGGIYIYIVDRHPRTKSKLRLFSFFRNRLLSFNNRLSEAGQHVERRNIQCHFLGYLVPQM